MESVKILELVSNTLNSNESALDYNFYNKMLQVLAKLFDASYRGIYFIDNDGFNCRAYDSNKPLELNKNIIDDINNTDSLTTVIKNPDNKFLIVSKLRVQGSVFGVAVAQRAYDFEEEEIKSFECLTSVISYLVKDYELGEVVKMQLKALQDAIAEKDSAYTLIEKQHKKLLELDKTKNAFLANISHELRTPLNAIIGFSQALGAKIFGDLNQKQEEYVSDIQASGLHLLGMINEILDISKIESRAMKISPAEMSPAVIINDVINILSPLSNKKNIEVVFVDECNSNIMADCQKFQQILFNLLSNAIKFTGENGKIEVKIAKCAKDFLLDVKDNGIGIDKKYHKKIFTKFVHLNNIYTKTQSSTGLGLTITKELVKLHNGTITLNSAPNKGTTFKIKFKGALL